MIEVKFMLDLRDFYFELKSQMEHQIFPKECYKALMKYYSDVVELSDRMCETLIEGTKNGIIRWHSLFEDELEPEHLPIFKWMRELLFETYEIKDVELRIDMVTEGDFSGYCYVRIREMDKRSKDWIVKYPTGQILIPDWFQTTFLMTEVFESSRIDFQPLADEFLKGIDLFNEDLDEEEW